MITDGKPTAAFLKSGFTGIASYGRFAERSSGNVCCTKIQWETIRL